MHLGLQLQDQYSSSSTESANLPHQELTAMGKKTTCSQDQCASSESVHDEGKHVQDISVLSIPELSMNGSHTEISHPMVQYPYVACPDPYLSGLFTAYGPHAMYQPQVMGAVAPGRVPIPADLPEDGPVYVNAKQYHGILRRRQTRAKLEAQNKLVKNRRPYLHESRHQHALNRVRGTGGRFLSKNSELHPPTSSQNVPDSFHYNQEGSMSITNNHHPYISSHHGTSSAAEGATVSSADTGFQHMVISMQGGGGGGGGLVYNGNRHYASSSIVR